MKTAFERVVPLVGKEYIIHRTYEEVRNARADEKCVGTAKLIAVTLAVEGPERTTVEETLAAPTKGKPCMSGLRIVMLSPNGRAIGNHLKAFTCGELGECEV
ncbi:uncharacterized protein [Physcomitrium patens]|uniref:uncharacterized protein n=1 Tax=Physcomitrium patens TaxID=3218 RepID=UPI000D1603F0|nr:uncharacterized protein LOC112282154 [Physcomitrium patens]|eukprot:XP_024375215.1 uncharacterized protein LOC112282154 [Physcomitrella patens]